MPVTKLTVLLSGMIAGVPHKGGAAWAAPRSLLGLKCLGDNVLLAETVHEVMRVGVPF
jgi:hypothetical protein